MVDLTKDDFEEEVLKAKGPVLVDFYGDGCAPCQALMPHVHAMEDTYGKQMTFCFPVNIGADSGHCRL